jgi:hypothetical protein
MSLSLKIRSFRLPIPFSIEEAMDRMRIVDEAISLGKVVLRCASVMTQIDVVSQISLELRKRADACTYIL